MNVNYRRSSIKKRRHKNVHSFSRKNENFIEKSKMISNVRNHNEISSIHLRNDDEFDAYKKKTIIMFFRISKFSNNICTIKTINIRKMIYEKIHRQKIHVDNNEIRFIKIDERNYDETFQLCEQFTRNKTIYTQQQISTMFSLLKL